MVLATSITGKPTVTDHPQYLSSLIAGSILPLTPAPNSLPIGREYPRPLCPVFFRISRALSGSLLAMGFVVTMGTGSNCFSPTPTDAPRSPLPGSTKSNWTGTGESGLFPSEVISTCSTHRPKPLPTFPDKLPAPHDWQNGLKRIVQKL